MGETPDLGNVTIKQRFTEGTDYYQDLVDLKENTTYFYRALRRSGKSKNLETCGSTYGNNTEINSWLSTQNYY